MKALIRLKMHMVKAQALPPSIVEGWMPTAPSERAYDRAMNIAFLGIVAGLLGLEAVQRLYVGAYHVYWPLAGGGFQATFGMVGLFAIHWLRAGCPRERQALMASAIILGFSLAFLRGVAFKNDYAFVGLTLVQASMATHAIWVLREKRLSPLRLRNIRDSWFVLLAGLLAGPMLDLSTHYGPLNDAHIFAFEERLGVRVESLVHALVMLFPFGHDFLDWIYSMTEAIFVVPLLTSRPRANPFVPSLVGVGAIGYGLYALCPAIGIQIAAYYSSLWPAANVAPADFAYLTGFAAFPRNCVPSIHAACA